MSSKSGTFADGDLHPSVVLQKQQREGETEYVSRCHDCTCLRRKAHEVSLCGKESPRNLKIGLNLKFHGHCLI